MQAYGVTLYNIKLLVKWWEDGRKYISNWVK